MNVKIKIKMTKGKKKIWLKLLEITKHKYPIVKCGPPWANTIVISLWKITRPQAMNGEW